MVNLKTLDLEHKTLHMTISSYFSKVRVRARTETATLRRDANVREDAIKKIMKASRTRVLTPMSVQRWKIRRLAQLENLQVLKIFAGKNLFPEPDKEVRYSPCARRANYIVWSN